MVFYFILLYFKVVCTQRVVGALVEPLQLTEVSIRVITLSMGLWVVLHLHQIYRFPRMPLDLLVIASYLLQPRYHLCITVDNKWDNHHQGTIMVALMDIINNRIATVSNNRNNHCRVSARLEVEMDRDVAAMAKLTSMLVSFENCTTHFI